MLRSEAEEEKSCAVCGGRAYVFAPVVWPELAAEWRLSPEEVAYIDRQQGCRCASCGSNLRSIALGAAISRWLGSNVPLREFRSPRDEPIQILEINEAGMLSPLLQRLGSWTFAAYPDVDIHDLPYKDASFDLVVHSDTLEHVSEPVRGLAECRRVLKGDGACCYTVPMIIGRLSASRAGMQPSFHGAPDVDHTGMLVNTEFGADAWTYPLRAGFERVTLTAFEFPTALAFTCEASRP